MKLYYNAFKFFINKAFRKKSTGEALKLFVEKMGITYIKLAQILATQNYGDLFTEEDRQELQTICDNSNPIPFKKIKKCLENEYDNLDEIFSYISEEPTGSASVSQVHKAVLKNGDVVALKIKRMDVAKTLGSDIKTIRKLVNKYIKFLKRHKFFRKLIQKKISVLDLNNVIGINKALNIYYEWILEETNFSHEIENIKSYQEFADHVNGKIPNSKRIVLPKLYEEYSTNNIIVMEFIEHKTLTYIHDSIENQERIAQAVNSYFKLSFYAMFHGYDVIFHGDPHIGNVYLDPDGNIGFLDMGLLFKLSKNDISLTKKLFLASFTENPDKLFQLIKVYGRFTKEEEIAFKQDIAYYSSQLKNKDITCYFTDLIEVCIKYNIAPPKFLFCMAKAFVCLNGINHLAHNQSLGFDLLEDQAIEFMMDEIFDNSDAFKDVLASGPKLLIDVIGSSFNELKERGLSSILDSKNIIKNGITKGISKEYKRLNEKDDIKKLFEDIDTLLSVLKIRLIEK